MAKHVVVIEDRASFGPSMVREVSRRGLPCQWITHDQALSAGPDRWAEVALVLLDAFDIGAQQSDPTRSRLASLDVMVELPPGPPVVVYSTAMSRPEVNIPLRGPGRAAGFYDVFSLTDQLDSIIAGELHGQVPPPADGDYKELDPRLPVGADGAGAHRRMQTHPRSWRQIWDEHAPFDKAAQVWISRNVLPLLGSPDGGGYGMAVNVVRRVAGLPFRLA